MPRTTRTTAQAGKPATPAAMPAKASTGKPATPATPAKPAGLAAIPAPPNAATVAAQAKAAAASGATGAQAQAKPARTRNAGQRYTNCVVCGWQFTQTGGQARPNCQAPNACARRVALGYLPGIGASTGPHSHARGLQGTYAATYGPKAGAPLTPAMAKAAQRAALQAGMCTALPPASLATPATPAAVTAGAGK